MAEPPPGSAHPAPTLPRGATVTARRLMRPWVAVLGGAALLVSGERVAGAAFGHSGERFDRLVDLSLVTFVSIGLVWAPMWTMRSVRLAWRHIDRPARFACARQVLLQGLVVAPALWLAVGWLTREVHGGRMVSASALGSVLISLGAAGSLWLRARR